MARTSIASYALLCSSTLGLLDGKSSMLLFSALGVPPFRTVKLRSRKPTCPACGKDGEKIGQLEDVDYVAFCGGQRPDWEKIGLQQGDSAPRIRAKVSL